ncbi:MAG: O-methyltransferase [Phycisphaerae bacterium]|nr:O-methyltransferase [Phycisphaerae bacterium]
MTTAKYAAIGGGLLSLATVALALAAATAGKPAAGLEGEKMILTVLDELWEKEREGMLNIPPSDGHILRLLTEATNAQHVVEIGTSNGYSGIWFCLALRTTGGKLTTHELDPARADLARRNFERAGVDSLVTLVEGDAHKQVTKLTQPIDILFLDADKAGYVDYLNKLLPLVRPGGLILAHNTTDCGSQLQDYVKLVTNHPELETIFLREQDRGISVTLKKRGPSK